MQLSLGWGACRADGLQLLHVVAKMAKTTGECVRGDNKSSYSLLSILTSTIADAKNRRCIKTLTAVVQAHSNRDASFVDRNVGMHTHARNARQVGCHSFLQTISVCWHHKVLRWDAQVFANNTDAGWLFHCEITTSLIEKWITLPIQVPWLLGENQAAERNFPVEDKPQVAWRCECPAAVKLFFSARLVKQVAEQSVDKAFSSPRHW